MAIPRVELELKGPLHDLGPFAGAEAVLALLRWRGRPVGWLRVPVRDDWVRARQWQAALAAWCQQPATRAALSEPPPLAGPAPGLSIVVATHERPVALRACLSALAPLAGPLYEVIVVDSNPTTNATVSVVTSLAAGGLPVRYLCQTEPGLNQARNLGWRAARQALVAFLDDDAVVDSGWAAVVGRALTTPQVAGVAGPVLPLAVDTPEQELAEAWAAGPRAFARREFRAPQPGLAAAPMLAPSLEALPSARASVVGQGANLALRREWLLRVGGFDPRLEHGAGTDLLARVLAAGGRWVYLPEALLFQPLPNDQAALHRAVFDHGAGQGAFAAKQLWEAADPRALFDLLGRLAARARQSLRHRRGASALPLSLVALEAAGCLAGPLRYGQAAARRRPESDLAFAGPQASQKTS